MSAFSVRRTAQSRPDEPRQTCSPSHRSYGAALDVLYVVDVDIVTAYSGDEYVDEAEGDAKLEPASAPGESSA